MQQNAQPDPVDLARFFKPASVALVGATEDLSKFGGRCIRLMLDFGYEGRIYPINPKYDSFSGLTCYPDVMALPEVPDHVGIVVGTGHVMATLRQCAAKGVKFATVFTAGYAETGTERGRALQAEISAFCRETGVRVMGPNCNGMINFVHHFAMASTATIAGPRQKAGNVGIVSHSGGLGQVNTMWRAQQAGVPISYEVSCGNDADLDALDYARFMVADDASDVVLMLLERVPSGAKLAALGLEAEAKGKPVIVLKLGRTEAGSRAAASHTGALTGSDALHDAAFRQWGMIRVEDCPELYETAMLLRRRDRRPRGNRLAGMAISGGNAVQLADLGAAHGLRWPSYSAETQVKLAQWMPGFGSIGNPTDLTAGAIGQKDTYASVLEVIAADENVDTVVPILTFAARDEILRVRELAQSLPKPVAVLWSGGCSDDPSLDTRVFAEANVPIYRDTRALLQAASRAAGYAEFARAYAARAPLVRPAGMSEAAAREALGLGDLTEATSKRVLAAYGLAVTREALAGSGAEAVAIAARMGGKVALKILSPDIAHKTEAGGVRLGLAAPDEIAAAHDAIIASARAYAPGARIEGVLVQEMVPLGVEIMLGVSNDPVLGPAVSVALGGIFVEVMGDIVHHLAPLGPEDAAAMLRGLKGAKLLEGVRGMPPADVGALADAMVRLSWLAHDLADVIAEIDLNPVIVGATGLRVADALIVRR